MSTEEKRFKLISMVCNADQIGIDILYEKIVEGHKNKDMKTSEKKSKKNSVKNFSDKDIAHAFRRVIPELFGEDILYSSLAAVICVAVIEDLFEEE